MRLSGERKGGGKPSHSKGARGGPMEGVAQMKSATQQEVMKTEQGGIVVLDFGGSTRN